MNGLGMQKIENEVIIIIVKKCKIMVVWVV